MTKNRSLSSNLTIFLMMAIFILTIFPTTFSLEETKEKEVLFISSYNNSFPTWYNQLNGIKDVLKNDYVLDVEVMDSKRFYDQEYLSLIDDLFKYKYENRRKPDAIIVADDNAYNYILEKKDTYFKGIPIVFIGVNTVKNAIGVEVIPNITGFVESLSMKETIDIGIKLIPNSKRIVYIVDDTPTGQGQLQNFNRIKYTYENRYDIKPILLKDHSFEELETELKKLLTTDVVILFSANLDKNNIRINFNDVMDIINENTYVPVFHLWKYGVGDGLVGGKVVSHYKYGIKAGTLVKNILTGRKNIQNITVTTESSNDYIFDYNILEKYKIDHNLLPKDSILINHPKSNDDLIQEYQDTILAYIFAMIIMFSLLIFLIFNIKERKRYESEIREMAFFDKFTGLPNRISLKEEIEKETKSGNTGALISFDIDNFKTINDAYGHTIGDDVLFEIGNLLKKNLGENNFLAKIDGDEFAILLKNQHKKEHVYSYVKKLLQEINERINVGPYSFYITFSIGISIYPKDGNDFENLFMNAEMALYKAKEYGKNTVVFYEDSFNEGLKAKLDLQYELVDALKNDEMYLVFQPKYLISNNSIKNYEALLRWNSKKLGNVPPDTFIKVAEEMGLITEIGRFVLGESCKFIKYMEKNGYKVGVSVNVSPNELNREDYVLTVTETIHKYEVNPEQIGLELTESVLITNFIKVKRILEKMSGIGIKILLDDFGKGYSSLNYIRKLPINTLKIDKSFIDKIEESEEDRVMIKSIIEIAQVNGMNIIAEGVEKEEQLTILKELKCDAIQGYLIAKPFILEEIIENIEKILKERSGGDASI